MITARVKDAIWNFLWPFSPVGPWEQEEEGRRRDEETDRREENTCRRRRRRRCRGQQQKGTALRSLGHKMPNISVSPFNEVYGVTKTLLLATRMGLGDLPEFEPRVVVATRNLTPESS